jgi:hypothetical protein
MDIKNRSKEYDCCKKMQIADDKSKCCVEGCLQGFGFFEYSLGDWILIAAFYIGKTHCFQWTAGAFLMTKNTPLTSLRA